MKITLLRTWQTNIGNGFIDKGAKVIIRRAFPDADIVEVSGFPNKAAEKMALGPLAGGIWRKFGSAGQKMRDDRLQTQPIRKNMLNVSEFVDTDLAILPGCVLYDVGIEPYFPTLLELQDRNIPIVILGGGGGDYQPDTRKYVVDKLEQLDNCGIISRDGKAYECYKDAVDIAYNGIDCAFFINEWYSPPDSNQTVTTSTFDKIEEPSLATNNRIIRPDHNPFGRSKPYQSLVRNIRDRVNSRNDFNKENVFVSDLITDYLFFYANSEVTHSDRIHACVPSLAYGNKAKFYFDTPRGALFDNVDLSNISKEVVSLDDNIEEKKETQIKQLRDVVEVVS